MDFSIRYIGTYDYTIRIGTHHTNTAFQTTAVHQYSTALSPFASTARSGAWLPWLRRGIMPVLLDKALLTEINRTSTHTRRHGIDGACDIIYYGGKIIGGIYDDRFLVKPVKSAVSLMPNAVYELPYEGAKEMLLVDNVDSREFLAKLFNGMYDELPLPKKKKT